MSVTNLIFDYTVLTEYPNTRDVKAPNLRVIDSGKRIGNGKFLSMENLERSFIDLEYKKPLVQNRQTINIHLRFETGNPVPFYSTRQVALTLNFEKICRMDDY